MKVEVNKSAWYWILIGFFVLGLLFSSYLFN